MSAFITTTGLRKYYQIGDQEVRAINDVDLSIERSTFTIVEGPSGSGKSTLLYLVGGLDHATGGKIEVDGESLDDMDANRLAVYRREKVGFIFQSYNLIASMTALDNVSFPLRFAGVHDRERNTRALELLKMVGLENRARHRPIELSGGQQQRVAIARALINNPALIVADEPTGNLDSHSGFQLMELLSELHRVGRTILMVTHDSRMEKYASSVIYLMDGRVANKNEFILTNASND
jgi:putative ABC transport system ATP-binding protein